MVWGHKYKRRTLKLCLTDTNGRVNRYAVIPGRRSQGTGLKRIGTVVNLWGRYYTVILTQPVIMRETTFSW